MRTVVAFVLAFVLVSVSVVQADETLVCWGMDCGSALEMECCNFTIGKCCNKHKTYCNETICGSKAEGWYCGTCKSFANNDCCNDRLTICRGTTTCGFKEDYECCPAGSPRTCCSILPPTQPPPNIAQEWWFWLGLILMFVSLGFIGFVLWSDRLFIKYNIDKALGKNPQPPPGMPFHRRASIRLRASLRQSRQTMQKASVRLSTRRRRAPQVKTPEHKGGAPEGVDNPEITALGVPPPAVPGPPSLDGVRSTRTAEPQVHNRPSASTYSDVRSRSPGGGVGGGRSGGGGADRGGGEGGGGGSLYPKVTLDDALTPVRYQKEQGRGVGGRKENSGGVEGGRNDGGRRDTHNPPYNTEMPPTAPSIPRSQAPPPPSRAYVPQQNPPQPQQYPQVPPRSHPVRPRYAPQPPTLPPAQYVPQQVPQHYASPLPPQPVHHYAPLPPQPQPFVPMPPPPPQPFMVAPQPAYGAPAPGGYAYPPPPPAPPSGGYPIYQTQNMTEYRI